MIGIGRAVLCGGDGFGPLPDTIADGGEFNRLPAEAHVMTGLRGEYRHFAPWSRVNDRRGECSGNGGGMPWRR